MGVFPGSNAVKASAAIMRTPKLKVPSSNAFDEVASVPVAQAHVHFGRLDVLINNTGLNLVGTVEALATH